MGFFSEKAAIHVHPAGEGRAAAHTRIEIQHPEHEGATVAFTHQKGRRMVAGGEGTAEVFGQVIELGEGAELQHFHLVAPAL